jgi:hypothetical protein
LNNRIDPSQFSPTALKIVNDSAFPKTTDPCGRLLWGAPSVEDDHQMVGRIDYARNSNHSIFGRYMATHLKSPSAYSLAKLLIAAGAQEQNAFAQAFTIGDTYLISSNVVNSFRFAGNRNAAARIEGKFFSLADLGVPVFTYGGKSTAITVQGAFNVNQNPSGKTNVAVFSLNDDLSLIRGTNQIMIGGSVARFQYNFKSEQWSRGTPIFNGQITGLAMGDFLTGNVFTFTQSPPDTHRAKQWYAGLYVQDTWKVNARLTLNGGIRWEPYFPQERIDGLIGHFDLAAFNSGQKTTQFTNAPPGLFYPGDPGFPGNTGIQTRWTNFSPRVGLAWDPQGNGRTSVRAAFGMTYDFPQFQIFLPFGISPPWQPRFDLINVKLDNPYQNVPGGNIFPVTIGKNATYPQFSLISSINYDTHNPIVSQWNLAIQHQVSPNWLVSASYIGNSTVHIWGQKPLNPAIFLGLQACTINGVNYPVCSTIANTSQRRRFFLQNAATGQYYGNVNQVDDGLTANYHGLLTSVERRLAKGLSVSANFTWSHCISDPGVQIFSGNAGNGSYTHPDDRRADRGNCVTSATDRRKVFNLTAVAQTPRFANTALRTIASNWRFSPIVRMQSGAYLTVTTTADAALNGMAAQRVNQVLSDVYGTGTAQRWLNPSAFAVPAAGTLGNMGVASVQGPWVWQFDTALSRSFQVREKQRIELRAEAFNLTNSVHLNNPVVNINAGNFGQITSAQDPRIMQFALKYVF